MPAITTSTAAARSLRRTGAIAGGLYLITFVTSIPAAILLAPVLDQADYVVGAGLDNRIILACILDLLNAFACVGTAVVLYPLVKHQNRVTALGFVTSRLFEASIIATGVVALLTVVTLRQAYADGTVTDAASLQTVGTALVEARNWTFQLGPSLIPAFNALLLGSLLYRSGLVPRIIPLMGLIGAPLQLAAVTAAMFGLVEAQSTWTAIAVVPIFLWELSVGLWMLLRGFRPTPVAGRFLAAAQARIEE